MKNFNQDGEIVTVTAPAAVSSGDLVQVGQLVGVAIADAANGDPVEIQRRGVFTLPKNNAEALTAGQLVWWDGTEIRNATAVGRLIVGYAPEAAAGADTTAPILLDGTARADD